MGTHPVLPGPWNHPRVGLQRQEISWNRRLQIGRMVRRLQLVLMRSSLDHFTASTPTREWDSISAHGPDRPIWIHKRYHVFYTGYSTYMYILQHSLEAPHVDWETTAQRPSSTTKPGAAWRAWRNKSIQKQEDLLPYGCGVALSATMT